MPIPSSQFRDVARSHMWDGSLETFRKSGGITVFIFAQGLGVDVEVGTEECVYSVRALRASIDVMLIQRIDTSNWYLLVVLRYQNQ